MVKQDARFVDSDIYFINYKAPYLGGAPNIHEVGVNELGQLKSRNAFDQYQEIYFITHSMGGLVTKSMLAQLNRGEDVARLRQIKGVIFLGAPAQGADLARLGAWLSMNMQIHNLEPAHFNAYLQSLEDQWVQLMEDRDRGNGFFPRVYCAYETLPSGVSIIVPREMTTSRCDGPPQPMQLNHSDLATPKGKDDDPYLWAMARLKEASDIASKKRELPSAVSSESDDESIHIECHFGFMPTIIPAEGRIYVLYAYPTDLQYGGGGLMEVFGPPGNKQSWEIGDGPSPGYKCQSTNYGRSPIFNVQMVFGLSFREIERDKDNPGSSRSGKITLSRGWLVQVNKIDQGHNNPFVFYIYNASEQFLSIILSKSAMVQMGGTKRNSIVPVVQPDADMILSQKLSKEK